MTDRRPNLPLRLRKKHGSGKHRNASASDGARLAAEQSLLKAVVAALIAIVVFCALWVALSSLTERVFPWMTIALGAMLGFAVRRAGRGVDWRFPAVAAALTLAGSLIGNIAIAAAYTAESFDTGMLQILRAVTSMTWPVYFDEVLNAADALYAVFAAGLAAFLANRRLSRAEFYALRVWRAESDGHQ